MRYKGNKKQLLQSDQGTVQRPGAGNGVRGKDYGVSAIATEFLLNTQYGSTDSLPSILFYKHLAQEHSQC